MKLILKWLLLSAALLLVSQWDSGIEVKNFGSAMLARPLLVVLTLPVTLLTLGLFLFVINAITFQMASGLLEGFHVASFWDALLGSVLYSVWGIVIDVALERLMPSRRADIS